MAAILRYPRYWKNRVCCLVDNGNSLEVVINLKIKLLLTHSLSQSPSDFIRRSETAWLLGSRLRFPLGGMNVRFLCLFFCCVASGLCDELITTSQESAGCVGPVIVCVLETSKDAAKLDLRWMPQKIKSTYILKIFATVRFAVPWRYGGGAEVCLYFSLTSALVSLCRIR